MTEELAEMNRHIDLEYAGRGLIDMAEFIRVMCWEQAMFADMGVGSGVAMLAELLTPVVTALGYFDKKEVTR